MKVQIKEKSSGKIKTMDRRYAEILVRLKLASFVNDTNLNTATPKQSVTKVIERHNENKPIENSPPPTETEDDTVEETADTIANDENTSVATEQNIRDNDAAVTEEKPKKAQKGKRGRHSNKYETKVMTAKE